RLPWVFLAIAVLSVGLVKLNALATSRLSSRRALSLVTLIAALITLGFFALGQQLGAWGLYALYVWSGLLATLILAHFWDLVAERFSITQAKRLYGFIGAGSVLGAIAGSGAASLLARAMRAERLVLAAAVGLAIAGLIPLLFAERASAPRSSEAAPRLSETLAYVAHDPYALRVVAALFLATVTLTISDFVFKSSIAALVPKAQLGAFLGSVYFVINVLSLLCQVGLVAWILRRLSLGAALGVLPALLMLCGLGVAVTGALAAVIALKAVDGSLRYSLHRTTAELSILPFGDDGRQRVKAFVDLVGQRGGQVAASLAILGFAAVNAPTRVVACGLAAIAGLWFACALALRGPYVAVFRARLKAGRTSQVERFPELDVASLETLLSSFESPNDREVLAALNVLERENKIHVIPALLLHHPSELVVLSVLTLLTRSGRRAAVPTIQRITEHPSPKVRAAAFAALAVLAPNTDQLRKRLIDEPSEEVRATLLVNLLVAGDFLSSEREAQLDALLHHGTAPARVAFAEAVGRSRAPGFERALIALLQATEPEVRRAAARAMGNIASAAVLPYLVTALGDEPTRADAERALINYGGSALPALTERFQELSTPHSLRWRIPSAMALCSPEAALSLLIDWLPREPDGGVRFGILLVLERIIRQHPTLSVDRAALGRSVAETLARAYRYLDARLNLERGAAQDPARKTLGYELLHDLLRDKEANARGRLFRLLGLLYPTEDFGQIYRSLTLSKHHRATSVELLESILREPVRSAVLGLVDDCTDDLRLTRAGRYHRVQPLAYATLLAQLAKGESDAVQQLTRHHAAELGLHSVTTQSGRAA
ncbi:MAG TPA: HEAT repeat domain-containing protein, partial [Polyangiaceae bacterium]